MKTKFCTLILSFLILCSISYGEVINLYDGVVINDYGNTSVIDNLTYRYYELCNSTGKHLIVPLGVYNMSDKHVTVHYMDKSYIIPSGFDYTIIIDSYPLNQCAYFYVTYPLDTNLFNLSFYANNDIALPADLDFTTLAGILIGFAVLFFLLYAI